MFQYPGIGIKRSVRNEKWGVTKTIKTRQLEGGLDRFRLQGHHSTDIFSMHGPVSELPDWATLHTTTATI